MLDPATIAASAIAKLAFDEFVKTGAGEAAKTTVAGAAELVKGLRDKIRTKFHGNERALRAVVEVEQGDSTALERVGKYLDLEMEEEPDFRQEIRKIAREVINIQNRIPKALQQQNNNYGRDQFIINQPQSDIRIGGG